jgi:hypothetical protein|tara:strand:+ start:5584 stop:6168 length:585 start_codon:yes stop_codon:yes gene_type:complete
MSKNTQKDERIRQSYIQEVDKVAYNMEQIWGVNGLEKLANKELVEKFNNAKKKMNIAIRDRVEPVLFSKAANNLKKGYLALDKAVRLDGHKPPTGDVWKAVSKEGKEFYIVKNELEKDIVFEKIGGGIIYALEEIACILETLHEVNECKKIFRKASVEKFDCIDIDGRKVKVTGHDKDIKYHEPFDDIPPWIEE